MNNVRDLRKKKGIQQKELAIEIGVSNATVSDWEHGRKNPSGERLRKLSEFFEVEPQVVLGDGVVEDVPFDTQNEYGEETNQIIQQILDKLNTQPRTKEAKAIAKGIDSLPKEQREQAKNVFIAMFSQFADYFDEGNEDEQ